MALGLAIVGCSNNKIATITTETTVQQSETTASKYFKQYN